jgi:hypothetical protein
LLGRPLSAICTTAERLGAASPEAAMHSESLALVRVETRYRSRDGRLIPMLGARSALRDEDGRVEGVVCVAFDLTERKEFVAQLFQSEKLASIGHLASGIAHESGRPPSSPPPWSCRAARRASRNSVRRKQLEEIPPGW